MVARIGISCDWERAVDRRGDPLARYQLNEAYVLATAGAQTAVTMLPHQHPSRVDALLDGLDGLVLSGGDCDVPPGYYGQAARSGLGRLVPLRSAFELALAAAAWSRGLPTLGICGGMQVINVALGGSLLQDLRERPDSLAHEQPGPRRLPSHPVAVAPSSQLHALLGADRVAVNSLHHQLIDRLAPALTASAHAPDGVIEAVEAPTAAFFLGVQWHPEVLGDGPHERLFAALIAAAAVRRGEAPVADAEG